MKRTVSKILCIITALCVFLGTMPIIAFAGDEPNGYVVVDEIEAIKFSPETELEVPNTVTGSFEANKFFGNGNTENTPYLFYSQLTDVQKTIYNTVLNAGVSETITLPFDNPNETPYVGSGTSYDEALASAENTLTNDVIAAITAVCEDNPMIFWVNGFGYGYRYYYGNDGTTYYVYVVNIELAISLDTNSYADFTVVQQKYDELLNAVNNFKVNGINRHEKLKSINDQLCDIVTYPENQGTETNPNYGPMAHQPTGALLNGSAVCEGYAEALKLICDREGIPCITAVGVGDGGAHKWNYVQMDDGLWYLVDVTWNDQITVKYYNWFITGSDFDGGDHVNTGKMYNADFSLVYPTLSKENYSLGVLMSDTGDMAYNNTKGVLYVGKEYTTIQSVFECIGLPSNCEISWTGYYKVTGQIIDFTNTDTSVEKSYLVAMRGDINASNTTTTDDYNLVVSIATAKNTVTEKSANFYAGDMTQDGAIDGFDAIALELYLNDTLKFD